MIDETAVRQRYLALSLHLDERARRIFAATEARTAGYRSLDAFTPFPVEGLAELLGFRDRRILTIGLAGAVFGFAIAVVMQVLANYDYPLDIGGRPLYALSAFAVITFELTILFSAGSTKVGCGEVSSLSRRNTPVGSGRSA